MREIKFRAWDGETMHYDTTPYAVKDNGILCVGSRGYNESHYSIETNIDCLAKDVMQFTGLRDKNGKEIYEGDIIKNKHSGNLKIHYDPGFACYVASNTRNNTDLMSYMYEYGLQLEVIGNIYENPELLESNNGSH